MITEEYRKALFLYGKYTLSFELRRLFDNFVEFSYCTKILDNGNLVLVAKVKGNSVNI